MEMEMDGNGNVDGCSMHCEALRVKVASIITVLSW
jgi:hypothetical protein